VEQFRRLALPIMSVVVRVVTGLAVMDVMLAGLKVNVVAPGVTRETLRVKTEGCVGFTATCACEPMPCCARCV
jgi:acyl CoA:acetate/3-ketoacid CoA transferase beta subunit